MEANQPILQDIHYIEQIRKRLWSGREFGNVSVMVGAGFSLNAEKFSENSPSFLQWGELINEMLKDLYPNQEKYHWNTGSDALKLANEYELVFGRQALNDLIIRSLPDQNYVPGKLHKLLLSLPWSDIFTTNYDTLLERTRPYIHDKKYNVVLTPSDLPGQLKPRIIKLHGSFPSHRPFIITEEDYRSYPRKFASFVNTVQQSIMENTLCLIGFSGDDPNFLNWIGWVRDNLQQETPPIYFCGFISAAQKRSLEARNIIPIDFTPLFPEETYPGVTKFEKALEWFLMTLKNGKNPESYRWPVTSNNDSKLQDPTLPFIPPGPAQFTSLGEISPNEKLQKEELLEVLERWGKIRKEYPGWIIAPKENRERLRKYTDYWIHPILNSLEKVSFSAQLSILYEMNWRLETMLSPWSLHLRDMEKISDVLKSTNVFPNLIEDIHEKSLVLKELGKNGELFKLREYWLDLAFAIIKFAREEMNFDLFNYWIKKIEPIVQLKLDWKAKWYHEKCLFFLFSFNMIQLKETLEEWPNTEELPFWEMKRSSLLAEIGDIKEAEKIAESALSRVRLRQSHNTEDYTLLSQEGWGMLLLNIIKRGSSYMNKVGSEYRERWAKLSLYHCNPWQEIETTMAILKASHPQLPKSTLIKRGFDPGVITHTFSYGNVQNEVNLTYTFLRMFENGGIPFRCGYVSMYGKEIEHSAKWIKPYSPLWAISAAIRTGNVKAIEEWFDRYSVLKISNEEVNAFYDLFIPAMEQAIDEHLKGKNKHSFLQRQLPIYMEIVSRFCFRFSQEQLDIIFALAQKTYSSRLFRSDISLQKSISRLFRRLIGEFNNEQLLKVMGDLLILPLPSEDDGDLMDYLVEPFECIEWTNDFKLPKTFNRDIWDEPISHLLKLTAEGKYEIRKRAVIRLNQLLKIKALNEEEEKRFSKALWSRVDPNSELPSDTNYLYSAFLHLPNSTENKASDKIRNFLAGKEVPLFVHVVEEDNGQKSISYTDGYSFINYVNELLTCTVPLYTLNDNKENRFINWTPIEAKSILNNIKKWWDKTKDHVQKEKKIAIQFMEEPNKNVDSLMPVLARVIIPYLDKEDEEVMEIITNLISEIEQAGYNIKALLPAALYLGIYSIDNTKNKLRYGLNSSDENDIDSSMFGIMYWVAYGKKGLIPPIPQELINDLVFKVFIRRQPKLDIALKYTVNLVKYFPECINEERVNMLCQTLEYLYVETEINYEEESISNFKLIADEDIPAFRALAVSLSSSLYTFFNKQNIKAPSIVGKWKNTLKSNKLPEVRRAWKIKED
ncbi:SIR2 family NAD-dependent protein deacylase [Priestia megaterium]|uniref:SIR2 family NAD-dependent protein deacylase n=1 Tax=Priestia megaterium TaxID=1404 RepID=UPI00390C54F2